MTRAHLISGVIRDTLRGTVVAHSTDPAISLSGGVDSCSVLASMLEVGMKPKVFSYTPSTHESTDFQMARETAATFGLEFFPVIVSMEPRDLEDGVRAITAHGFKTKLQVESMSPMIHILEAAAKEGVEHFFTGDQADGFFINNNWMARNFDRARGIPGYLRRPVSEDEDAWRIDELRRIYWDEDRSCSGNIATLARERGLSLVVPYRHRDIYDAFQGSHWREVNLPRFKEPIRLAFSDWFEKRGMNVLPKPVNLHRGDSYFAERMGEILMKQPHLKGSWRTVTGLYSAIARGLV